MTSYGVMAFGNTPRITRRGHLRSIEKRAHDASRASLFWDAEAWLKRAVPTHL